MTPSDIERVLRAHLLEQMVTERDVCKGFADTARRNSSETRSPAIARKLALEAEYWDRLARMRDATWRRLRTSWGAL